MYPSRAAIASVQTAVCRCWHTHLCFVHSVVHDVKQKELLHTTRSTLHAIHYMHQLYSARYSARPCANTCCEGRLVSGGTKIPYKYHAAWLPIAKPPKIITFLDQTPHAYAPESAPYRPSCCALTNATLGTAQ